MILTAITVFLFCYGFSWMATFLIIRVARRIEFVDRPGGRKVHEGNVPLGGGVAIFLGTLAPVLLGYILTTQRPWMLPESVRVQVGQLPLLAQHLLILWSGAAVLMVMGLIDDRWDLSPYLRLAVQFAVATSVYVLSYLAAGEDPEQIKLGAPVFMEHPFVQGALTVLWIVGLTNAFNFLDNTDGLCAGVAFVCSAVLLRVAWQQQQPMIVASLIAFMGGLAGFLLFNFPPARIFMGDAGSTFIGYYMAIMSMGVIYSRPGQEPPHPLLAIVIPVLVMIMPIYDAGTVIFMRIKERRSPFKPDRRHFSHRLLALGMTRAEVLATVYMVVFAIGVSATLLPEVDLWGGIVLIVQAAVILSLITLLENAGRRTRREP